MKQYGVLAEMVIGGAIAVPATQQVYTFHLAADALLYFNILGSSLNTRLRWTLEGPSGTLVDARVLSSAVNEFYLSGSADAIVNALAGDYTLTIDGPPDDDATGP